VTVASPGGPYQDAQAMAFFAPFELATGARVQQKTVGDLGELRGQVEQGAVTWDLVDVATEEVLPLARGDYLAPIDYRKVDKTPLFAETAMQHGVGAAFFATVLAYRAGEPNAPSGWRDFWDLARFPGGRALRRGPIGTLEFALVADGVPLANLYPLDVERAFAKLEAIRAAVVEWYDNARQPAALLAGGAASMASSYHVLPAAEGDPPGLVWAGGMLSADSWVVPRGAPNEDVAMDLINFATRAVPSANFSRLVPYGPANREAFPLLRPERRALLPNAEPQRRLLFLQNWNWWADNREELTDRFDDWLLAGPAPEPGEAQPPGES
jgi:putative spermidine/putrescine transport system substrate-binding protein